MARTKDYREWLIGELRDDPEHAVRYLNASLEEGSGAFLVALKDVVDAQGGTSALGQKVTAHRVSIHGMLKDKGNPTFRNLDEIMNACGLRFTVEKREHKAAG